MAKVLGVGGVFFKAKDPAALRNWYRDKLGLSIEDWGGSVLHSEPKTFTIWNPFAADSTYFPGPLMINFRVDDLDALLAKLRADGVNVLDRYEKTDDGAFGYVVDPEGTMLELWQPPPPKAD
jgi:catechol 2,3-dioxygenase-like lactoylglutathione lyase family enzyme